MKDSIFFNAHHAPIGAFATLTLGSKGPCGGLGLELAGPADESIYVGIEEADRPGHYNALPFFQSLDSSLEEQQHLDVEGLSDLQYKPAVSAFADREISRDFGASSDEWTAGDMTFRIVSPVGSVPDPESTDEQALISALAPAVIVELTLDNRHGLRPRKAFFGYAGSERSAKMRTWNERGIVGIGQGTTTAIATDSADVYAGIAWQPESILNARHVENLPFMLGTIGLLVGVVPPGAVRTFRFAVCFFREGTATTGLRTRYLYRRWFSRVEEVAKYALEQADALIRKGRAFDRVLTSELDKSRAIMAAQSIRSYYGCTQCLEQESGKPLWIVHEGEYRMMNTFDLTVDQAFFELSLNPWTVRNELDLYADRYVYHDKVTFPGNPLEYPGGIAFTHDVGIANSFAEPGRSGYEQAGLRGCFSHMTCEELVNWALTACMYISHTSDWAWARTRLTTFEEVLQSLMNRDHSDPASRNGVMGLDSNRCAGGAEITTYDSLDASLGQARNNIYLAVKAWAAYVLLEPVLRSLNKPNLASAAADQAARCARTLVASVEGDGTLPAVLDEDVAARIIPVIEGLVYPFIVGRTDLVASDGPFGDLRRCLETHLDKVLQTGKCRFVDGGWRLSSTSRNSWLSKIFLCQFVAEHIFGEEQDAVADAAHLAWMLDEENSYYAFCDQMLEGKAVGSRYYPRGVTCVLWLLSPDNPNLHALAEKWSGSSAPADARV